MIHKVTKATFPALCAQLLLISQENKSMKEKAELTFTDKWDDIFLSLSFNNLMGGCTGLFCTT